MEKANMKFIAVLIIIVIVGTSIAIAINAYTGWASKITPLALPAAAGG